MATKPSLALIPSGYRANKLYSVLPSNGDGDFDFSRSGSATRINKDGLIETVSSNVPRLNYPMIDGVVSGCPSLLLEPTRTNLITYSEEFDNSYWGKVSASATSGFVSPDGTNNAYKLVEDTSNAKHYIARNNLFTPDGITRDYSIFVKEGERRYIFITNVTTINNDINSVVFDTRNGVFTNTNETTYILNRNVTTLTNGWYRIDFTSNINSGAYDNFYIGISSSETMSGVSYQGDGTSGVYIYGAQLEQGSYATSYIPTNGEVNGVTRSAETATGSGDAATFNDSEGVFMAEVSKDKGTQYSLISLQKSSVSDTYAYIGYLNNNTTIRGQIKVGGTTVLDEEIEMSDTSIVAKILIKYKSGDYSMWVNGFEVGSTTNSAIFSDGDLNEIEFGYNNNSSFRFYGNTKQIQYFDTALTDTDLETLTSWVSFQEMAEGQLYKTY